jgi:anaerobic selenocysteine-containing dehydrogenase
MFLLEKLARRVDTPHIDLLGGAGTRAVRSVLQWTAGFDAGTCSLRDLLDADLVVLWGAGLQANPFVTRLLHLAHRGGTRVLALGGQAEPEFDGVWLPSEAGSTVLGSRVVDEHIPVTPGGDRHLAWALMAELLWQAGIDLPYLEERAEGWQPLLEPLRELRLEPLAAACGVEPARLRHLARTLACARSCVVLTGPELGAGSEGNQAAGAVVTLSLLLGLIGRPGSGLLPLGGQPGWQGGRDLGCSPRASAGHGWHAPQIVAGACEDELDLLYVAGDGLAAHLPEDADPAEVLRSTRVRVHQVLELDPSVLAEPGEVVLVLPVQSRFEQRGGATATSVDRIVRFSPEVRGHSIEGCRPDWQVPALIAQRLVPEERARFDPVDSAAVREQIAASVDRYAPIDQLHAPGHAFQWGGPTLHEEGFATPDGRARVPPIEPPQA